jgi:hypothetical protein
MLFADYMPTWWLLSAALAPLLVSGVVVVMSLLDRLGKAIEDSDGWEDL